MAYYFIPRFIIYLSENIRTMPTQFQERVFNQTMILKKEKKPVSISKIMKEEGAGIEYAKHPQDMTGSKGWQQLLAQYDDKPIMDLIYQEALDKSDKRNATANRDILLKLKDRYPAQKSKVIGLFGGLSDLE
jgi:hypothetical protein